MAISKRCVHTLYTDSSNRGSRACITPELNMRLFGHKRPEQIGCGTTACAFTSKEPDKIVKLTKDKSDVRHLPAASGKYGPIVYDVQKVNDHTWAMVVEKLDTIPVGNLRTGGFGYALKSAAFMADSVKDLPWPAFRKVAQKAVVNICAHYQDKTAATCKHIVSNVLEAKRALRKKGINWTDIHLGNIGYSRRDKRWKPLDLGTFSWTEDLMNGAGSRRKLR